MWYLTREGTLHSILVEFLALSKIGQGWDPNNTRFTPSRPVPLRATLSPPTKTIILLLQRCGMAFLSCKRFFINSRLQKQVMSTAWSDDDPLPLCYALASSFTRDPSCFQIQFEFLSMIPVDWVCFSVYFLMTYLFKPARSGLWSPP